MTKTGLVVGIIIIIILAAGGILLFSGKQKQEIMSLSEETETGEELITQPEQTPTPTSAPQLPVIKEFSIAIDENNVNPNTINVNNGDKVKITFTFNDNNIYYGGLDVYDPEKKYININYKKADPDIVNVEFIAEKSFTYTGYWPNTGNVKASGKVDVIG